jgi:hypothetical protein
MEEGRKRDRLIFNRIPGIPKLRIVIHSQGEGSSELRLLWLRTQKLNLRGKKKNV